MTRTSSLLALGAVLIGTAACDMPATFEPRPDAQRHVGIVEWSRGNAQTVADPAMAVITAPDTVAAAVPFQVTITTVGPNGCWRPAGAEGGVQGALAEITPFDRIEGEICTQALVSLPRTLQLRFDERGEATIRVHGRRVLDGNLTGATGRTVEKRVVVR